MVIYAMMKMMKDPIKLIKDVLRDRSPQFIEEERSLFIHAAVLMPLFSDEGEYKFLFTRRTNRVEHHKGQISFPGGAVDKKDPSFEETALREAYEEIGLLRKDVTIIGQMDDILTVASNFIVHPFVGLIPHPYEYRINVEEVKRLISVPLKVFFIDNPENRKDSIEFNSIKYPTPIYLYNGDLIWGATARIMENLVDIIGERLDLPEGVK